MAEFREIPTPTYEYEIDQLVSYYEKALQQISRELERIDLTNIQRAHMLAVQKEIAGILAELDEKAGAWVATNLPKATEDGVIRAIIALGVVETVEEAQKIVAFNRLNSDLVKTAIADTQDDLMQISQNINRKVRTAIREVTAESIRSNLSRGINASDPIKRDIVAELRKRLGDSINTGIIDASNRRWNPKVYAEMVVRTKMAHTERESSINEALGRGANYGVISSHGAKDACRNWEGKIVKLTPEAEGAFPYVGSLPRREIFHPNCKHVVSPVRRLDRLPESIRNNNGV
jgi:hypothetical protein